MPSIIEINCWSCKTQNEREQNVTRNDYCSKCSMPLKCCYNCRFYDRNSNHQCRETQAEWVRYKEKANFCSYFEAKIEGEVFEDIVVEITKEDQRSQSEPAKNRHRNGKDKNKDAWDSLFKD